MWSPDRLLNLAKYGFIALQRDFGMLRLHKNLG